jgi:hypothetical protein
MQNSFPSGSVITVQVMPCSWCVAYSVAPSPRKRATSAMRSAAWKSRCIRFFTVFPSGTFRNNRRTGSVADVRSATSGVASASYRPVAAAQNAASRPGSTASNVMLVSSMVIVLRTRWGDRSWWRDGVQRAHRQCKRRAMHAEPDDAILPLDRCGKANRLGCEPQAPGPPGHLRGLLSHCMAAMRLPPSGWSRLPV